MTFASATKASFGRISAIFLKETIQMRRDRLTFGMLFGIPILQLVLFGFAINTNPKDLPTAVVIDEHTTLTRSILHAFENSGYYEIVLETSDPRESDMLLRSGKVAFVITIPPGFTDKMIRGEKPQLLIEADASDPSASSNAIGRAEGIVRSALRNDLVGPLAFLASDAPSYDLVIHSVYNPEAITQYNIVPGLLGVILTMTMVMITSIAMTREAERGTMENLLAMPARPAEVMTGKITPYVMIGAVQTIVILVAADQLFRVPFLGDFRLLLMGVALFVIANLAIGFTFSTIARNQMQAMQLTFFFFLPSILLSGFMFPFRGMPSWAQHIGEVLPLTHFLRLIRGIMLKGTQFADLRPEYLALSFFTVFVSLIAMLRYRKTLD